MIERRAQAGAVIEAKEVADTGTVKVRAASFLNLDRGKEIILPGAYQTHLGRYAIKGRVFLDHEHSTRAKVGNVMAAYEDTTGLISIAKFNATKLGQETRRQAQNGELKDVSIGHQVFRDRYVTAAEVKRIWERFNYEPTALDLAILSKAGNRIRIIEEAEPAEFSFVGIPMNDYAETLEVKANGVETKRGAVLSRTNANSLKQAYRLIRAIFKSAKIEDADSDEVHPEAQGQQSKQATESERPASGSVETKSPEPEKTGAELRAKRLRLELELMSMEPESEAFRVAPVESMDTETEAAGQWQPVTQE